MSDLLNSASLVMIPSGYKEDTVYSVVPSDGSGDLSFTRASNGTRINSAGLVEVCPWNLMQYSEDITNAAWGEFGATRSANTATAPNGTTTADTILPSATTSTHGIFQQITVAGGIYSASAYFKANGYNYACIRIATNSDTTRYGVVISLIDGSVTATDASGSPTNTSYSIETAGNGWFKLNVSCSHSSGFIYHTVGVSNVAVPTFANSLPSFTANGTSSIYIWGAQLNIGATAKPYFPTTDRLNVPRLTYQNGGGGCPSLLLEKQSTNISFQSTITSFGSGANEWLNAAGTPVAINQTTGIDGTQNGAKYTRTAGQTTNDFFYKNQVPVTSGTTYTVSGYIKLGTASNAVVVINNTSAWNSVPNGSIVCSTANGFSTTAWKRFELTITGPATNKINIHYGYHEETGVAAQATGTFFLDGLQVEASSYATSYIPTTSSSATRVADACFKTGISSLIGQTEGTALLDFQFNGVNDAIILDIAASGLSPQNRIILYQPNSTVVQFIVLYNDTNPVSIASSSYAIGQRLKVAIAYKENDFAFYINGVQIGTDSSGSVPATSRIDIGNRQDGAYPASITVNEFYLSKTRLTNAELAQLTA